jgi:peptide/nickel transport system permease protein
VTYGSVALLFYLTPQYGEWTLPGTHLPLTGSLYELDPWKGKVWSLENMILPVLTLMIRPLGVVVQLTRSSLLETMSQDFVRTAVAKGLGPYQVIMRHALPNALNPVLTSISSWFASLLAGAVFVEFVFGWKGLGQLMFTAIERQDLPVISGGVMVISSSFVVIGFVMDGVYRWLDPRVREM